MPTPESSSGAPPDTPFILDDPLLVGFLIDVSAPFTGRMPHSGNGLEEIKWKLERMVRVASDAAVQLAPICARVELFAYGFGFGNPLSIWLTGIRDPVRDLFVESPCHEASTLSLHQLCQESDAIAAHLNKLSLEMFGEAAMAAGLHAAHMRFARERASGWSHPNPVLFLVSNGSTEDKIRVLSLAEALRSRGVIIASCYIADTDSLTASTLYSSADAQWPAGARLMFEIASTLEGDSVFLGRARQRGWSAQSGARLFAEVNQPKALVDFLSVVLSPFGEPWRDGK